MSYNSLKYNYYLFAQAANRGNCLTGMGILCPIKISPPRKGGDIEQSTIEELLSLPAYHHSSESCEHEE
jgi:hypothetical protein